MANNYVVTRIDLQGSNYFLYGTVNGAEVNLSFPSSKTFANVVAFQNFVAPLMLAALPPSISPNAFPAFIVSFSQ